MKQSILRPATLVPLALLVALALLPLVATLIDETYYITLVARMLIYAIAASALNLALGFGGLISFGHALFFGIGAYSVALPSFYGFDNALLHLLVALVVSGAVGAVTGYLSLRTTGIGFIMITLAFAQMGYFLFVSLKQFGGDDGLSIYDTSRIAGMDLGDSLTLYIISFVILVMVLVWFSVMRQAPFGMVLRGARQNSKRIASIGLAVKRYQLTAYVISAMICSVAGMLMANLNAYASPNLLSWMLSGEMMVMVVLGGVGTLFGPLLGALSFLILEEILSGFTDHWMAILGVLLLLVAVLDRDGIVGLLKRIRFKAAEPKKSRRLAEGKS